MILAIDLGSTSFKVGVFDLKLRQVSAGGHKLAHRFASGKRVEIDVDVANTTLRRAIAAAKVLSHDIKAIAITSQAQTFTVVDARGRAKRPFVSWQDGRATQAAAQLKRTLKHFGDHCSFGDVLAALQICQLKQAPIQSTDIALKLPSYFVRLWSGENVTDDNIAAMGGLYSLKLGRWWPKALQAVGLRENQLPRVVPVGSVAAHTTSMARRFGLPSGIPIVLAGNDQTSGAFAARLHEQGGLLLTLGTAQVAYACLAKMPASNPALVRGPYPGGLFYRLAADGCGGSVVNWAKTILAGCDTDQRFFAQAARAKAGTDGLVFEASLDAGHATWRNLGLHHTSGDLARAVIASLSQRMAVMVKNMGINASRYKVLVAGGGNRQPLWIQILSEEIGVRLTRTEADPLLGAARMGNELPRSSQ